MSYNKNNYNSFAAYANYSAFYDALLQKVKNKWNRTGNEILGLSDSKVSRLFTGKQKDIETLVKMAEFMQIKIRFQLDES